MKIKDWTQKSLKNRLRMNLSHDWIHEDKSHKFPLREYYVQLEWKKKIRTAMGRESVTLTSIYDLIKHLTSPDSNADISSVIIEGKIEFSFVTKMLKTSKHNIKI